MPTELLSLVLCRPTIVSPFLYLNLSCSEQWDCDLVRERTCLHVSYSYYNYSFMQFLSQTIAENIDFLKFHCRINGTSYTEGREEISHETYSWNQNHLSSPFLMTFCMFKVVIVVQFHAFTFDFNSISEFVLSWET